MRHQPAQSTQQENAAPTMHGPSYAIATDYVLLDCHHAYATARLREPHDFTLTALQSLGMLTLSALHRTIATLADCGVMCTLFRKRRDALPTALNSTRSVGILVEMLRIV